MENLDRIYRYYISNIFNFIGNFLVLVLVGWKKPIVKDFTSKDCMIMNKKNMLRQNFLKVEAVNPAYADLVQYLGNTFYKLEEYSNAKKYFEQMLKEPCV